MIAALVAVVLAAPSVFEEAAALRAADQPQAAVQVLVDHAERTPDDALAPDALWDAARILLDRLNRPEAARPLLTRLVERYPDHRTAQRARRQLEWLDARRADRAADALARLPDRLEALRDWVAAHPDHPDAWMAHVRLSALLPAEQAVAWLARHENGEKGWLLARERMRRLHAAGRYREAWVVARRVKDPAWQRRAGLYWLKSMAPWIVGGLAILFVALLARHQRRRRRRWAELD